MGVYLARFNAEINETLGLGLEPEDWSRRSPIQRILEYLE